MDFMELRERIASATSLSVRWFTTTAKPGQLWALYLNAFPEAERQEYNCNACRHFIERYGGMAYVDNEGTITPVCWSSPGLRHPAEIILGEYVRRQRVNGIFYTHKEIVGQPETCRPAMKSFTHFYAMVPEASRIRYRKPSHIMKMQAKKREEARMLIYNFARYTMPAVEQTLRIFQRLRGSFYRVDTFIKQIEWFLTIKRAWELEAIRTKRINTIWRVVAEAPDGWCDIRSTRIGFVLDTIQSSH